MVFSSLLFLLLFLPVFLIGYQITPTRYKNSFSLLMSILFYTWGAPKFIFIALGSILFDFFIVKEMHKHDERKRFILLWCSIALNVALLLYFKYANFFIDNVNSLFFSNNPIHWQEIILPIGISFFTFQKISYSVDIYQRVEHPLKRINDYALYILLFPQLIAGPIVRFREISMQLVNRDHYNYNGKLYGLYRFSIGLAKKVLIANVLGEKANLIFGLDSVDLSSSIAWLGILCYTFQIYFDFSGYSDMAIGLGAMMGFKFPENFNSPYIAQSITEFWRRWHMTLSRWMRDYLYIPLGGNRVNTALRLYANLWIVFLISGFWHGAAWNFILWGAFHGFFIVCDRLFLNKLSRYFGKVGRLLLTFFIVVLSWVIFRAETLTDALDYYAALFSFDFTTLHLFVNDKLIIMLCLAFLLSFLLIIKPLELNYEAAIHSDSTQAKVTKGFISLVLIFICVANLTSTGFNPFIYFRF